MAVAEAALGRMGSNQLERYTTGNARVQLDPSIWELPGAMPEIAPSPDFEANIERKFTERSMALQAWGAYGVLWPVVHYQLGVAPDIGRSTLRVVPQVPSGQTRVSGSAIRLGRGNVAVSAQRRGSAPRHRRAAGPSLALDDRRAAALGCERHEGPARPPQGVVPGGHDRAGPRGLGRRRTGHRDDPAAGVLPLTPRFVCDLAGHAGGRVADESEGGR